MFDMVDTAFLVMEEGWSSAISSGIFQGKRVVCIKYEMKILRFYLEWRSRSTYIAYSVHRENGEYVRDGNFFVTLK